VTSPLTPLLTSGGGNLDNRIGRKLFCITYDSQIKKGSLPSYPIVLK